MEVEFDSAKDAANLAKHGIGLRFGASVISDPNVLTTPVVARGEDRYRSLGLVAGRVYVAIWTERGNSIRFISVRKANDREVRKYRQAPPKH